MNCRDFRNAHLDFTDRTLSAAHLADALGHLEVCPDCARFDALVRRSLMLVHSLPAAAPDSRVSPRLAARLALLRSAPAAARPRLSWLSTGFLAAAGVAFAAGIATAALLFRRPVPSVAALPPVVALATAPRAEPAPLVRPDFMPPMSAPTLLWSSVGFTDEAPARFVSAQPVLLLLTH